MISKKRPKGSFFIRMNKIRINKFIADNSSHSRRQADRLVELGEVLVNGRTAKLGEKVNGNETIEVLGEKIKIQREKVLIAYHKPIGVICTTDKRSKDNIVSKINYKERIYPIGRLDVNTSGLILLTNASIFKRKYEDPNSLIEKEYVAVVNKDISNKFIDKMGDGVNIGGYTTKPARAKKLTSRNFSLIITEGKNRQIRKMVQKLGYEVIKLIRIRIDNIELSDLERGSWKVVKNIVLDTSN